MYKGDWKKGEIEILQPVSIFKNKFLEIFNDEVKFPSGYEGTYIRISYPVNESIAVLPITPEGKIILIKTFRHGTRGWGYEVPKGGMLEGEDPEEAARRELREETGISAGKLIYQGDYSDSPAIYSSMLKCYLALDCVRENSADIEETEAISGIVTVDPEEFLQYEEELDFRDSMTEMMIFKYLRYLKKL